MVLVLVVSVTTFCCLICSWTGKSQSFDLRRARKSSNLEDVEQGMGSLVGGRDRTSYPPFPVNSLSVVRWLFLSSSQFER